MIPKYRAFLKAEKKIYPVATLYLSAFAQQVELVGKGFTAAFTISEEVELVQATGFKDKHGNEAYAGDILELNCLGFGGTYTTRAVITWSDFGWWLDMPDETVRYQRLQSKWQAESEIVGNIWEHKHLLNLEEAQ